MVKLVDMSEAEYETFMENSMSDQVQRLVQAGIWPADEADERIKEQQAQLLPEGRDTANHFFYMILDQESQNKVGELWYTEAELEEQELIFVLDVQVYREFRRRGYGSAAFERLEDQAREKGITLIALDVVEENVAARAMYEKLGYSGQDHRMSKNLA